MRTLSSTVLARNRIISSAKPHHILLDDKAVLLVLDHVIPSDGVLRAPNSHYRGIAGDLQIHPRLILAPQPLPGVRNFG